MKPHVLAAFALSAASLALLVLNAVDPDRIDALTIGLLGIAALPWFWPMIESVGFPGGSIRFRELKETQRRQEDEIRALQFLVTHLLTAAERTHLDKLAKREHFPLSRETPGPFFDEIRRLRSLGFIEQAGDRGVASLQQELGDVREYFVVTPSGVQYLTLLDQVNRPTGS